MSHDLVTGPGFCVRGQYLPLLLRIESPREKRWTLFQLCAFKIFLSNVNLERTTQMKIRSIACLVFAWIQISAAPLMKHRANSSYHWSFERKGSMSFWICSLCLKMWNWSSQSQSSPKHCRQFSLFSQMFLFTYLFCLREGTAGQALPQLSQHHRELVSAHWGGSSWLGKAKWLARGSWRGPTQGLESYFKFLVITWSQDFILEGKNKQTNKNHIVKCIVSGRYSDLILYKKTCC